jgi:hypothetical protein
VIARSRADAFGTYKEQTNFLSQTNLFNEMLKRDPTLAKLAMVACSMGISA